MAFDLTARGADGAASAPADRRAAVVEAVTDRREWDRLMCEAPSPHLPQSWAYGEAKATKGWLVHRVRFRLDDRIVAFATVLERRLLGLTLVTRVNRGPVLLEANPAPSTVGAVYQALRRRWGGFGRGPLMIAPALPHDAASETALRGAGYFRRQNLSWQSGRIDLTVDELAIWSSLTPAFRNRWRKSEAAGATVRVADDRDTFDWMVERHLRNMAEKHFHAVDGAFLGTLRASLPPEDLLVFQVLLDGVPVAGMSVVRFGDLAEYHVGWVGEQGRRVNAGNALMWAIIREMKRRGATALDLGGLKEGDGYTRFKRTMSPVEYRLVGEWVSVF